MSVVLREDQGGVAVITINRPQARNAIDAEAARALAGLVVEVERDPSVHVAILTGAGGKAFCAGADLKELAGGSAAGGRSTAEGGFAGFVHAPREKLWIAAVNGAAVAGGFELVLACDFAIASDPAGALVERVPMPDRSTTNICFGGADGRDAYITLSRSGRLAVRRWARQGLLTPS